MFYTSNTGFFSFTELVHECITRVGFSLPHDTLTYITLGTQRLAFLRSAVWKFCLQQSQLKSSEVHLAESILYEDLFLKKTSSVFICLITRTSGNFFADILVDYVGLDNLPFDLMVLALCMQVIGFLVC